MAAAGIDPKLILDSASAVGSVINNNPVISGAAGGTIGNLLTELIKDKILKKNKGKAVEINKPISEEPNAAKIINANHGFVVIEADGITYVIRDQDVPDIIFEMLKDQKDDKLLGGKQISMIKTDTIGEAISTAKNYNIFDSSLPSGLNDYYRGLFLSIRDVEEFYRNKNKPAGDKARVNIGLIYGAPGNLFCNLHTQGYIGKGLDYFTRSGGDINSDAINLYLSLLIKYWDSVFFVGKGHDFGYYYPSFKNSIQGKKSYIALHGIGERNIEIIDRLLAKLKEDGINLESLGYEVRIPSGLTSLALPKKDAYIFDEDGKKDFELFQSL
jgi:hypothetical protein